MQKASAERGQTLDGLERQKGTDPGWPLPVSPFGARSERDLIVFHSVFAPSFDGFPGLPPAVLWRGILTLPCIGYLETESNAVAIFRCCRYHHPDVFWHFTGSSSGELSSRCRHQHPFSTGLDFWSPARAFDLSKTAARRMGPATRYAPDDLTNTARQGAAKVVHF